MGREPQWKTIGGIMFLGSLALLSVMLLLFVFRVI